MSEDNRWPRNADTGDLLYCHAVGNKYGWYLNQMLDSKSRVPLLRYRRK